MASLCVPHAHADTHALPVISKLLAGGGRLWEQLLPGQLGPYPELCLGIPQGENSGKRSWALSSPFGSLWAHLAISMLIVKSSREAAALPMLPAHGSGLHPELWGLVSSRLLLAENVQGRGAPPSFLGAPGPEAGRSAAVGVC